MKTHIKDLFLLPALIAGLGLMLTGKATALTFTNLYSFTAIADPYYTNGDGAYPQAGLILSGNTLYGTAGVGGTSGNGAVFAVNIDGTGFTNLHSFTATSDPYYTNSDGTFPYGGLVLSGNTLYGTAQQGGSSGLGTVFKVNTDGTGFTNLHSFAGSPSDGANPQAGLILSGNTLYGTAWQGGSPNYGTVFAVNTNGTGFTNLHSFTLGSGSYPYISNSDGAYPQARLILSGNILYGTASQGGSSQKGTVFALNTDGMGFTTLHSFTATSISPPYGNSDGARPSAGLILSGNTLYGTANRGGSFGDGTVFAVNTNGTGFTNLHSFTSTIDSYPYYTNSDGAYPEAELILSGTTLYGTADSGGSSGSGTVFSVNTNGTGFTTLYSFTALSNNTNSDGVFPDAGLLLSSNTLYGTADSGGGSGSGTVFGLLGLFLIIDQPQSQYVFPGENATFTVLAGGTLPLSYQWQFYGTNLASATDSNFTRSNVQSNHFGNYDVVVTNVSGSITSEVATLGYIPNPVLTNQYLSGGTFTFTLNGYTGRNYLIQQTTNLPNWSNVLTFSNILGPVLFTETNANTFFKVFRAKIAP